MPIWARALIIGLSLIGYIIVFFCTLRRSYKKKLLELGEKTAKAHRRALKLYNIIVIAILLGVFIFPTYIFLSTIKMLICLAILHSCIFAMLLTFPYKRHLMGFRLLVFIFCLLFVLSFTVFSAITFSNTLLCTKEDVSVQTIEPTMFSDNKIAYTCDNEGNIEKYFYYYNDNGEFKYKEFAESEVEVIEIKNKDTYIEKTTKTLEWVHTEINPSAVDYTFKNTEEEYVLYINYNQAIEITN